MKRLDYVRCAEDVNTKQNRMILFYYLTEGSDDEKRYGIEVEMYVQLPDQRTVKESCAVGNLFSDRQKAEDFVDLVCESTVPPLTLREVVFDYIESENDDTLKNLSSLA